MRVLCFGSLNLDHIYNVQEFVRPGETCKALSVEEHCGGKGFNQAAAAAKAGLPVSLAGCIGEDGGVFLDKCRQAGVDTAHLSRVEEPTGSAVIQVNQRGENCILLYGGAMIAIGVFISSLTVSQIIAAIGTFAVSVFLMYIDMLASSVSNAAVSAIIQWISFNTRYETFTQGMFSISAAVFFLSVMAVFVFLTARRLESRRWAS